MLEIRRRVIEFIMVFRNDVHSFTLAKSSGLRKVFKCSGLDNSYLANSSLVSSTSFKILSTGAVYNPNKVLKMKL